MSYAIDIDDIQTLANVTAQLDHVKNFLPAGSMAWSESAMLVAQAHVVLESVLCADAHLVYSPDPESPDPEEQTA